MTLICGIDEARRGPIIGPMALCGVLTDEEGEKKLKEIGAKDSKELTPEQRTKLDPKIKKIVKEYVIIIVPQSEIDTSVNQKKLNYLEADKQAEIINKLKPEKAIIDCPSPNIEAYTKYLNSKLKVITSLLCAHHADRDHVTVGAASILAKVAGDAEIEKIKKEINLDFGSGYLTDPKTKEFIEKNWKKYPQIFRQSWEPYKKLKQPKIGDYDKSN